MVAAKDNMFIPGGGGGTKLNETGRRRIIIECDEVRFLYSFEGICKRNKIQGTCLQSDIRH